PRALGRLAEPGAGAPHRGRPPFPRLVEGGGDPPRRRAAARAHAVMRPTARHPPLRAVHEVRGAARRVRACWRSGSNLVRRMTRYVLARLLRAVTTLLGTTLIIFVLLRVIPADPAVSIPAPKAHPAT